MGFGYPELTTFFLNSLSVSNKMREVALLYSDHFQEILMPDCSLTMPTQNRVSFWRKLLCTSCIPLGFFLFPLTVNSQTMEVGAFGGGAYYLGDLNPGKHFLNTQISYGALVRYNFDTRWAVKLSVARGKVKGNASQSSFLPDRNLQFESPVTDISATCEFNFFSYFTGSRWNSISPYIYTGIGVFFYDPSSGGQKLRALGTEGQNVNYNGRTPYSTTSVEIPMGLGVKYSLTKALGITVFWELHKTFTDYLDDVSTTYYLAGPSIDVNDPAQVLSDPTRDHQPEMQRGNPENNDWYSFFGVSLTFKFNLVSSRKCKDKKFN
jgi:hypothetical protein